MRADRLDDYDIAILRRAVPRGLERWRGGWAESWKDAVIHSKRIDGLVKAGLLQRAAMPDHSTKVFVTRAGRARLAEREDAA